MKKRPLILGLGLTGLAVAEFFESKKEAYLAFDDKIQNHQIQKFQYMELLSLEAALNKSFDYLIVSPGVDPKHPIYQKASNESLQIMSEIELAMQFLNSKIIGITGTNGKTTVTKFLEEGLKKIGFDAIACGNYGIPLISLVGKEKENTVLCCELSSYQLENTFSKKLDYGLILNITQDHLDRYHDMYSYAKAKFQITSLIKEGGKMFMQKKLAEQFPELTSDKKAIFYHSESLKVEQLSLFSPREKENWIAAFLVMQEFGMSHDQMNELLLSFHKPEHRIEHVAHIDGVDYYDDSKGTNVDAVIFAAEKFKEPLILLLGGKDKGSDYTPWIEAFKGKVKKMIVFGEAKEKIFQVLNENFDITKVEKLEEATSFAKAEAKFGDVVLLSPGCSSFDQFKDYKHRAEVYRNCLNSFSHQKM